MNLYYRNLKRMGIGMILVSIVNLYYEDLLRSMLTTMNSAYVDHIPLYWGIWVKNLIGAAAGVTALIFYKQKKHYRIGTTILFNLCLAEAAVIILSTNGSLGVRTNSLVDMTMLMMGILTYTISQTDRDLNRWKRISGRQPAVLDLRLHDPGHFFNTIQAGPQMVINEEYASAVNRFLASTGPVPLHINLLCPKHISETMQDMMREVFVMNYEMEEKRIGKLLERNYNRIILLLVISLFSFGVLRQFTLLDDETIVWQVIGNFAAFGLWQIGTIHFERNEEFDDLLLVHCAKYAQLNILEK